MLDNTLDKIVIVDCLKIFLKLSSWRYILLRVERIFKNVFANQIENYEEFVLRKR